MTFKEAQCPNCAKPTTVQYEINNEYAFAQLNCPRCFADYEKHNLEVIEAFIDTVTVNETVTSV